MWFYLLMIALAGFLLGYYLGVQGEWRRMTRKRLWW